MEEEWQEKVYNREMEEAPENGKESSHSAHANGMNECVGCVVLGIQWALDLRT
jgi:hypothetical protein